MAPAMMAAIDLETLLHLRATWQREGQRLVLTNGVFDLLHVGHVAYLQEARTLGDILVVALNSDESTRAIKGPPRPLMPEQARAQVIAALRCVDCVTIFAQRTAEALLDALRPEIYVKGGDYARHDVPGQVAMENVDENRLPEARVVRGYGGQVVLLPYQPGYSTSELLARIGSMHESRDKL
jgi:rfaE bifunctional protein nucleotidyltransferase chain/domain